MFIRFARHQWCYLTVGGPCDQVVKTCANQEEGPNPSRFSRVWAFKFFWDPPPPPPPPPRSEAEPTLVRGRGPHPGKIFWIRACETANLSKLLIRCQATLAEVGGFRGDLVGFNKSFVPAVLGTAGVYARTL